MKRFALIALAGFVVIVVGVYLSLPFMAGMQVKGILKDAGFQDVKIGGTDKIPGGYVFNDIRLDSNNFSTIKSVTVQSMKDARVISIDKIILTGDWKKWDAPEIAGWVMPEKRSTLIKALRDHGFTSVVLEGGQFDAAVPLIGLARFEARGQVDLLPDGAMRVQSALWSVQKQLKADLRVNGEFGPNNVSSLDVEIGDGRIDIDNIVLSRTGGWLILNKSGDAPWSLSGQIMAGMAKLYGVTLSSLTFSVEGSAQDAKLTVQGTGNDAISLAGDAQFRTNGLDRVSVTLRADDFSTLFQSMAGLPPAPDKRPGGVLVFDANAPVAKDLLKNASFGISDLAGLVWMRGKIRREEAGVELDIQDMLMAQMIAALNIPHLQADGIFSGLLPVSKDKDGHPAFDQGLLQAVQSGGEIRYNGVSLPDGVTSSRDDALSLLKSLTYDKLEVSVNGPLSGDLSGDISITGKTENGKATLLTLHYTGGFAGN